MMPVQNCQDCSDIGLQQFLSPQTIAAYIHHLLSISEQEAVETHLQSCDACLGEVQHATRLARLQTAQDTRPVPTLLKARVAALWHPPQPATLPCSRLIVQIARSGLRLISQELVAPFRGVQPHLTPLSAYRNGNTLTRLTLDIQTQQADIKANLIQQGEGIALQLTLLGMERDTLARQRVFLRQQGRSLFSAKTDQQGTLQMPHLAPGTYEVACPGIPATFELELRS